LVWRLGHSSAKVGWCFTSGQVIPWIWVNWKYWRGGRI